MYQICGSIWQTLEFITKILLLALLRLGQATALAKSGLGLGPWAPKQNSRVIRAENIFNLYIIIVFVIHD